MYTFNVGDFRAILIGAAFGIFAFVGIGIWSVAIAGENTDEQFETGVTIALLYAEYCNETDIDRDLLLVSKYAKGLWPDRIQTRINRMKNEIVNSTNWCTSMKSRIQ